MFYGFEFIFNGLKLSVFLECFVDIYGILFISGFFVVFMGKENGVVILYLGFFLSNLIFGDFVIKFMGYLWLLNYDNYFLEFCCWVVVIIGLGFMLEVNFNLEVSCLFNLIGD